ncbi:hypothetical protein LPJ66_006146 [Kickxella alabastrina]|uniref:Uncharacterized protein n=1 Tax=Kickxella alabastrina TaxID=61397 RepID=A0ACC1ID53_9FUNG|nr:hypothetical protein LPJ66_006146 [Kickxella alabastrina]
MPQTIFALLALAIITAPVALVSAQLTITTTLPSALVPIITPIKFSPVIATPTPTTQTTTETLENIVMKTTTSHNTLTSLPNTSSSTKTKSDDHNTLTSLTSTSSSATGPAIELQYVAILVALVSCASAVAIF